MSDKIDMIDARTERIENKLDKLHDSVGRSSKETIKAITQHEARISAIEKRAGRQWILLVALTAAILGSVVLVVGERVWPEKVQAASKDKGE
jgi:hypothetical protein